MAEQEIFFIRPLDEHTRQTVERELANLRAEIHIKKQNGSGAMYLIPPTFDFIRTIINNMNKDKLLFTIYRQLRDGQLKTWAFANPGADGQKPKANK